MACALDDGPTRPLAPVPLNIQSNHMVCFLFYESPESASRLLVTRALKYIKIISLYSFIKIYEIIKIIYFHFFFIEKYNLIKIYKIIYIYIYVYRIMNKNIIYNKRGH